MTTASTIGVFDFAVGSLAALGLAYLLVSDTVVVHYRSFFRTTALGLFAFAATGPVVGELAPSLVHAVHGFAALVVTVALYRLVRQSLDRDAAFGVTADAAFDADPDAAADFDAGADGDD